MMMAPHPATKPAAGVIATRPVIIPFMAPTMVGLRKKIISIAIQVSKDIAVQMLVFKTAAPASGDAVYGSCVYGQHFSISFGGMKILRSTYAAIETIPSNPEYTRSDHDKGNIVWLETLTV
jgi:hypothetical protein